MEDFEKLLPDAGIVVPRRLTSIAQYILSGNEVTSLTTMSAIETALYQRQQKLQHPQDELATRVKNLQENPKAVIPIGDGAVKFGGLLDREAAKEDLHKGLEYLAKSRGKPNLDKKQVPVLALAGSSESGKTEFLRWVFNNCCTFSINAGETAQQVLGRINAASPDNVPNLDRLLVLFASFNQASTYTPGEGPITITTIERLVRSYEGRVDAVRMDASKSMLRSWSDLVEAFSKPGETTGFIICIDELSKLRQIDSKVFRTLMADLMQHSQYTIMDGGFFAVVGSSLYIYDFGEVVLQASGRAMRQIKFPKIRETIANKTRDFVLTSQVFAGSAARAADAQFSLNVALWVAQNSPSMNNWLRVAESRTRVKIPSMTHAIPDLVSADDVFLVAAQTALGQQQREIFNRDRIEAFVDRLHGDVELHDAEDDIYLQWPDLSVTLSLPPWRLLQFLFPNNKQVFSHVQNWVFVELYRLFYTDGISESVKTWELATMGALELRKAMLQVVSHATPSLRDVVGEIGAVLKVSDEVLDKTATAEAAANAFQALPSGSESCDRPCFYYAKKSNEEGVEGVFRNGFKDVSIFFQMKLYSVSSPKKIRDWLVNADSRAKELGYKEGTYVVVLFVTGAIKANVKKYYETWPQNSMVFEDVAIDRLFKPFGEGLFMDITRMRRRRK